MIMHSLSIALSILRNVPLASRRALAALLLHLYQPSQHRKVQAKYMTMCDETNIETSLRIKNKLGKGNHKTAISSNQFLFSSV